ncbi:hypothetical protein LCGC14_0641190 [marine sediment metagenome]|uniref:Mu-like prophage protein Com n=1 Tax=marine sediment metagenome TaxID=412755 RepID=A0A0F9R440_9ZZZZ|nr:Com family DNA-binding transcriptional regulator [archaeon]
MAKNKSVHCVECTKVIFTTKDDREVFDLIIKCPECKTLQSIEAKIVIKRKIIVERLDKV